MTPRPKLLTFLALIQWLIAAACAVLLVLKAIRTIANPASFKGLSFGILLFVAILIASLLAGKGIWQQRVWGLWIAITLFTLTLGVFLYAGYDADEWDPGLVVCMSAVAVMLALHLSPWVWRAFRASKLESPASTI